MTNGDMVEVAEQSTFAAELNLRMTLLLHQANEMLKAGRLVNDVTFSLCEEHDLWDLRMGRLSCGGTLYEPISQVVPEWLTLLVSALANRKDV